MGELGLMPGARSVRERRRSSRQDPAFASDDTAGALGEESGSTSRTARTGSRRPGPHRATAKHQNPNTLEKSRWLVQVIEFWCGRGQWDTRGVRDAPLMLRPP